MQMRMHKPQSDAIMSAADFNPILALLNSQISMISFQTCTQIYGIHKALIHVKR